MYIAQAAGLCAFVSDSQAACCSSCGSGSSILPGIARFDAPVRRRLAFGNGGNADDMVTLGESFVDAAKVACRLQLKLFSRV